MIEKTWTSSYRFPWTDGNCFNFLLIPLIVIIMHPGKLRGLWADGRFKVDASLPL
ncbi:hypothetical protein AmaxDRAFT_0728 [Limnospira maxima CS-328]|uniref:Uncharacterized protein n=1 Tax=Limnospira maxima CS-328 TaxID=513049 RepID=B5VW36_LIMMA|nr:hypothetical protein AmaxDRAFT_0728 [Limnospira maxima CS-328]UWU45940.1 hypothetical protein APLC1_0624 [Arthrospira platensis C1]